MSDISDDFDAATIGDWSMYNSSGWAITSGTLDGPSSATSFCSALVYDTPVDGINHWVKFQIIDFTTRPGICLRHGNTSSSEFYTFRPTELETRVAVERVWYDTGTPTRDSIDSTSLNATGNWAVNDYMAISIEGTGASTVASVWRNPSGTPDDPTGWGTADDTYTLTGGNYVDVGNYVGLHQQGASTAVEYNNFKGGLNSAGTSIPIFMNHYRQMRG